MWFLLAIGSSIFAALTSVLAKIGIEGVNSNLATAIRTFVVLLMSWGMVFITNTQGGDQQAELAFPHPVRSCHWGFLAVLLQGFTNWRGFQGRSYRQAECCDHYDFGSCHSA